MLKIGILGVGAIGRTIAAALDQKQFDGTSSRSRIKIAPGQKRCPRNFRTTQRSFPSTR